MSKKLKAILIALWVVLLYAVHYYFEFKKYLNLLQN